MTPSRIMFFMTCSNKQKKKVQNMIGFNMSICGRMFGVTPYTYTIAVRAFSVKGNTGMALRKNGFRFGEEVIYLPHPL